MTIETSFIKIVEKRMTFSTTQNFELETLAMFKNPYLPITFSFMQDSMDDNLWDGIHPQG